MKAIFFMILFFRRKVSKRIALMMPVEGLAQKPTGL